MKRTVDPAFWSGRRVLVTGHTGFKGSWLTLWLKAMGAHVTGVALAPDTQPSLCELAGVEESCRSIILDIVDADALRKVVVDARPQIILHLAAQPLVRLSYRDPLGTFAANVMGTANLLEAARDAPDLETVLIVTTDKVYENDNAGRAFVESDPLGGHDPYSASKAAAEIVTASWRRSFFNGNARVLAARAGNVIGGGDFSADRIVPDVWRAARAGVPLVLRYPNSTRPWQHVLDCLAGYLLYVEAAVRGEAVPHALNFGPAPGASEETVSALAAAMQASLGAASGWAQEKGAFPVEAAKLALDTSAARKALGWRDRYRTDEAIRRTAAWYSAFNAGEDMAAFTRRQIAEYCDGSVTDSSSLLAAAES
jgi:CDP-glucose 4,6-dehydratase